MDGNGTDVSMGRALRRVRASEPLGREDASVLLSARGDDLAEVCAAAARVRDEAIDDRAITFTRNVFIPLTKLCRDKCHYCTFVTVPGKLRATGSGMYLEPDEVLDIARRGAALGCKEVLFTLGDRPEVRWPEAREWLTVRGYGSTLDYLHAVSARVLAETGLLPHLNPGVLSAAELERLRPVAQSMGLMLETTSRRLFTEKGGCHYGSPDKDPQVRLRSITDAGRLSIPFTTGVLVGIGESHLDRVDSILAIRERNRMFGHIQEVIVQNFRAKPDTAMRSMPDADMDEFMATIAVTRLLLGSQTSVQAPPNLVSAQECAALIGAGIDDWGGVSPVTPDHVNPERPWPNLETLVELTAASGYRLVERTAAHARYVRDPRRWADPGIRSYVAALSDPETGLAVSDAGTGLPLSVGATA